MLLDFLKKLFTDNGPFTDKSNSYAGIRKQILCLFNTSFSKKSKLQHRHAREPSEAWLSH